MSRGPVSSQLHLLSNLPAVPVGDKVRFLGCNATAVVDVSLLLESLTAEQTRVGEFVNVIGYITEQKMTRDKKQPYQESKQVCVQAIVLWSTGPMDLQKYEKLLDSK
ncbi:hypothetical protein CEK26_008362 [Fusarium fujikuroi]|nr:hypothetical protein CEK27_008379 [Fusarium fujikuroi]QGI81668.1 hypothetical protein CEK25_008397 [Fusarium fujikuroi]QGI95293.1 hypothetical protein CEK26_008362 [Fusarium fujikuroi]